MSSDIVYMTFTFFAIETITILYNNIATSENCWLSMSGSCLSSPIAINYYIENVAIAFNISTESVNDTYTFAQTPLITSSCRKFNNSNSVYYGKYLVYIAKDY